MWEYEYSAETSVVPQALWRSWSDPLTWTEWNPGVAKIELDGPFEAGTTFRMTGPDGEVIELRLVEVVPGELWVDLAEGEDFQVRTVHRLEPLEGGCTRVVYRTEITGPLGPEIGPGITADFEEVVAGLIGHAGGGS